ncbi:MAG: cytochrome c oxidase accessory protein CcoG [Campylobacteraceae bacterium]|nr:cytochrome c oxidase accessory protein CcoG [Campylobacteraceae bacterium]
MSSTPQNKGSYTKKRYLLFVIVTFVIFIIPFMKIDERHLLLLSFEKKQFHLFFTIFDMQELSIITPLLILLFVGVFFITALGGRVWCGWACPQTIFRVLFRDFIQTKLLKLYKTVKNKREHIQKGAYFRKFVAVAIWVCLSLVAASNFMWYFVPPEDFFVYVQDLENHKVLMTFIIGITTFLVYDIIFLKENFCTYVCPYARIQSVMFDEDTVQTIYNDKRGGVIYDKDGNLISSKPKGENDECIGCEACVKICPTHIDIRKGMQLECINCLECADACTEIMDKLSKETLVSWTSPNAILNNTKVKFARFRTIGYGVVLVIALCILLYRSFTKEHMVLNIHTTTQSYAISKDTKSVENFYVFLFRNTDSKDHTYYFEVSNPDITIKKPEKHIFLKAGQQTKEIVILHTDKILVENNSGTTPIPITIKAYAIDNKEEIHTSKKAVFPYPRISELAK